MIEIGQNIVLEINDNGLSAYITILQDEQESYGGINLEEVLGKIESYIVYGLNKELLVSILEEEAVTNKILIAEGKDPINGEDGSVKYNFDIKKPLLPRLLENGTVDYKNLDAITQAVEGDILAEVIPPTMGIDGIKVTGEKIPSKKGRTPKLRPGKNTSLSLDEKFLLASKSGLVELTNGKVNVLELLKIENVDGSIGNIEFDGNIIVDNDILNGFSVKATGSVEVKGAVEGGFISSSGDILIRQGIQGYNKMTVNTRGNLSTKFIENSKVKVSGNITSEAIMHSNVSSNSNILVLGKKGLIVGGTCRATYEIIARIVGSNMATATTLEVGINPDLKNKYDDLELRLKTSEHNLKKIEQSLNMLGVLQRSNKLDDNKKQLYDDLLKAQSSLNIEIASMKKELNTLKTSINQLTRGQIKVADTVYPGVKIIIGNSFMFVRDTMKNCTFYQEDGEIRIGPY